MMEAAEAQLEQSYRLCVCDCLYAYVCMSVSLRERERGGGGHCRVTTGWRSVGVLPTLIILVIDI